MDWFYLNGQNFNAALKKGTNFTVTIFTKLREVQRHYVFVPNFTQLDHEILK